MTTKLLLLDLPPEVRDIIWHFAAATGGGTGLLRTCQLVKREAIPYFDLHNDVEEFEELRIWIDSTYINGNWLKLEYAWQHEGDHYRAINAIKDMDDPLVQKFMKSKKIGKVSVVLEAPRRGHFIGALLMMLAKCHDAYS